MSQDELSKRLGTSAKTVSKLINGKIDLTREMAMKLPSSLTHLSPCGLI